MSTARQLTHLSSALCAALGKASRWLEQSLEQFDSLEVRLALFLYFLIFWRVPLIL